MVVGHDEQSHGVPAEKAEGISVIIFIFRIQSIGLNAKRLKKKIRNEYPNLLQIQYSKKNF